MIKVILTHRNLHYLPSISERTLRINHFFIST